MWLDVTAARARYGVWIDGVLPEIIPFPSTGRPRGGSKTKPDSSNAKSDVSTSKSDSSYSKSDGSRGRAAQGTAPPTSSNGAVDDGEDGQAEEGAEDGEGHGYFLFLKKLRCDLPS